MLISTHIPVGRDPLKHKAGLLTYPLYRAFPIVISGKECDKQTLFIRFLPREQHNIRCILGLLNRYKSGIYSNWYCPRLSLDSLFTFRNAWSVKAPYVLQRYNFFILQQNNYDIFNM